MTDETMYQAFLAQDGRSPETQGDSNDRTISNPS
jgi:hypothetical protein